MKSFPLAAVFGRVACALVLASALQPALAADSPQAGSNDKNANKASAAKNTVRLIVDYGDGVAKHFDRIKWQDKMTVQDVTLAASKHPRGIKIKQRGKKATAFLSQIDDLANNPGGRSWVYRVNGTLADRSFGVYAVKAGDIVSWSYQDYP